MSPGPGPGEHGSTTLVLSVKEPVSFRRKGLGGGRGARQVFPAVNHYPQNRSNDAGTLQSPAAWNWVKWDLMSHSLR